MKLFFICFLSCLVIVNCQYYGQFQPNYDSNGNGFRAIRIQIPRSNFGLNSMNPFLFNPNQLMRNPILNEENPNNINEGPNENPQKSPQNLNPKQNEQVPRVIGLPIGGNFDGQNFRIVIDPNLLNQPNQPNQPDYRNEQPNKPSSPNTPVGIDYNNQPFVLPDGKPPGPIFPNAPISIGYNQPFILPNGKLAVINPDGSIGSPNIDQSNNPAQPKREENVDPTTENSATENSESVDTTPSSDNPQAENQPRKANKPSSDANPQAENQPRKANKPSLDANPQAENQPKKANKPSLDANPQEENQPRKANKPISQVSSTSVKDPKARPLICVTDKN